MSTIDKNEVKRVAALARIALSEAETERLAGEIAVISEAVAAVSQVATPDIPATSHPVPLVNVLRPDVVGKALTPQEALSGAPASAEDKFLVPQILGEE